MANRFYTSNSQLKLSGTKGGHNGRSGSVPSMKLSQSFTPLNLPGKASNGFSEMKKGYKEVNGYASYNGLSKGKGSGNWIQGAIKHPGALTKQAKKVGQTPMAFAKSHQNSPGKTGQRARLAMTLSKFK